jgi:S-adenosylmethionine hydrolase
MILTLLTDFGLSDSYVGVMKGAIATINPQLHVIDLTHHIPPQDVAMARFQLMVAYPYFPPGTVHVAVVDPGVGSSRRSIAIQLESGFLVGPDNGLFSGVLSQNASSSALSVGVIAAIELTNPHYWRTPNPSSTFHGRDIFAPVGAHLASGVPLQELGDTITIDSLVKLPISEAIETSTGVEGVVQAIDHFGNVITNIPGRLIQDRNWIVENNLDRYPGKQTYADAAVGEILGLVGSHGWIEIAVNRGNAHARSGLVVGSPISIKFS